MTGARVQVGSGSPWEPKVGYSRAVRVGNHISVAGTTATAKDGSVLSPGDPHGQAKAIFAIVGSALEAVGASFSDVVRTRIFLKDIAHWQEVGRAHGEIFSEIRPASTMVEVSRLIDPAHLVEIEVDAIIADEKPST